MRRITNRTNWTSFQFIRGIATGGLVFSLLFLGMFFFIDYFGMESKWTEITISIFTIIGSLLAALVALFGISSQIQSNIDLELERKEASLSAEKAALPFALSTVMGFCQYKIQEHFKIYHEHALKRSKNVEERELNEAYLTIKRCIEFADGVSRMKLANILGTAQVVTVRDSDNLKGIISDEKSLDNYYLVGKVIDWAVLYALCDQAFDFARGLERKIPCERVNKEVLTALRLAHVFPDDYQDLDSRLKIKTERDSFEFFTGREIG